MIIDTFLLFLALIIFSIYNAYANVKLFGSVGYKRTLSFLFFAASLLGAAILLVVSFALQIQKLF